MIINTMQTKRQTLQKMRSKVLCIKCVVVGDSSVGKEYKSYLYLE